MGPQEDDQSRQEDAKRLVFWNDLKDLWPSLPPGSRQVMVRDTAKALHRFWQEGGKLGMLNLSMLACYPFAENSHPRIPALPAGAHPEPRLRLMELMADWYLETKEVASLRERLCFLRTFMAQEDVERGFARPILAQVESLATGRALRRVGDTYRAALTFPATQGRRDGEAYSGFWAPRPDVTAVELKEAIREALALDTADVLKKGDKGQVVHTRLLGRDVIIKGFEIRTAGDRLKNAFRSSRGRRAFAAARTLQETGLPTPEPLGFLDVNVGSRPRRSYFMAVFLPHCTTVRAWLEEHYAGLPDEEQGGLRDDLMYALLDLYNNGIYHADTKTSNALLEYPEDRRRRQVIWIDLEHARFGFKPGRRKILRNLIQLNGSLGPTFPDASRRAFLDDLSPAYPWVTSWWVIQRIRGATWWRLFKERRGWAGP